LLFIGISAPILLSQPAKKLVDIDENATTHLEDSTVQTIFLPMK